MNKLRMAKPLISIIIPVYNDERYIARAIESCINQTYHKIEVVIVDDASTDKTSEIIAEYAKEDSRLKIIKHNQNKKTLKAIKTGVLAAKGSYIMVVSGDDAFDLNAVDTCVNVIRSNYNTDIVHFGRRIINKQGVVSNTLVPTATKLKEGDILKRLFSLSKGSNGSLSNKCWKRQLLVGVFRQIKPKKSLILGEDQVVVFLAALKAKKYVAITDIIHNYYFGIGMDGKTDINLEYYLNYRLNMADSMEELEKQLKSMKVEDWVWRHYIALKREHYAWSVLFTGRLNENDKKIALKSWTERTNAVDTLIGVASYIPERFLNDYMNFLMEYQPSGFNMKDCNEILKSLIEQYMLVIADKEMEINSVKSENQRLVEWTQQFMSIKRSARLLAGNIERRIKHIGNIR